MMGVNLNTYILKVTHDAFLCRFFYDNSDSPGGKQKAPSNILLEFHGK